MIAIDFYLQRVIFPIGFRVSQRKFQQINIFRCRRQAPQSALKIIAVVDERSAAGVGKSSMYLRYSTREELSTILDRTTRGERPKAEKVLDGETLVQLQGLVREVIIAPHVQDYAIRLALGTHPHGPFAADVTNQYIRWGSSPRGVQTLVLAAKVRSLLDGRFNVSFEDLRRVYLPSLRHRVLLNFEAQAEGIDPDEVLLKVLDAVPEKADVRAAVA